MSERPHGSVRVSRWLLLPPRTARTTDLSRDFLPRAAPGGEQPGGRRAQDGNPSTFESLTDANAKELGRSSCGGSTVGRRSPRCSASTPRWRHDHTRCTRGTQRFRSLRGEIWGENHRARHRVITGRYRDAETEVGSRSPGRPCAWAVGAVVNSVPSGATVLSPSIRVRRMRPSPSRVLRSPPSLGWWLISSLCLRLSCSFSAC